MSSLLILSNINTGFYRTLMCGFHGIVFICFYVHVYTNLEKYKSNKVFIFVVYFFVIVYSGFYLDGNKHMLTHQEKYILYIFYIYIYIYVYYVGETGAKRAP